MKKTLGNRTFNPLNESWKTLPLYPNTLNRKWLPRGSLFIFTNNPLTIPVTQEKKNGSAYCNIRLGVDRLGESHYHPVMKEE